MHHQHCSWWHVRLARTARHCHALGPCLMSVVGNRHRGAFSDASLSHLAPTQWPPLTPPPPRPPPPRRAARARMRAARAAARLHARYLRGRFRARGAACVARCGSCRVARCRGSAACQSTRRNLAATAGHAETSGTCGREGGRKVSECLHSSSRRRSLAGPEARRPRGGRSALTAATVCGSTWQHCKRSAWACKRTCSRAVINHERSLLASGQSPE